MTNITVISEYRLPFPYYPVASIIGLAGIFGNSLVVVVTLIKRHVRGLGAVLIGILALCDLIVCFGHLQVKHLRK